MGEVSEGMLFDIGYADGIIPALAVPEKPGLQWCEGRMTGIRTHYLLGYAVLNLKHGAWRRWITKIRTT